MDALVIGMSSLAPLVGVAMGAFLTYRLSERARKRDVRRAVLDRAIAAVAVLQASRHFAAEVPAEYTKSLPADHEAFQRSLREVGIRRFIKRAAACRDALAAANPFCPGVRPYFDKFEVSEAEMDELLDMLTTVRDI